MEGSPTIAPLPEEYETWAAAAKLDHLWKERILPSRYETLPALTPIHVLGLFLTPLRIKMDRQEDQVPRRWRKAIHAHGSVARVQWRARAGQPYSGLFQGAEHGLIRLSLTGDPQRRGFAPGLALKLFRDGCASANLSALVSLTGQNGNHNFFANELSNIVPVVPEFGPKLINQIFRRVSRYPTRLYLENLAEIDQKGHRVEQPRFPEQVFFVPNGELVFPEAPGHDFREDLASLSSGTLLYEIWAPPPRQDGEGDRRDQAEPIADLLLTSPFLSSAYGDSHLFFRHQRFHNR